MEEKANQPLNGDQVTFISPNKTTIASASDKMLATTDEENDETSSHMDGKTSKSKLDLTKSFDDVLEMVGSFGRYQKKMMILLFVPVSFFAAFTSNLFLFQMVDLDHWCYTPGRENTSLSQEEWRLLTQPKVSGTEEPSKCLMHEISWFHYNATTTTFTISNKTKDCSHGWKFDTSQFSATVATTMNWVCDRKDYSYKTISISMSGNAFGSFILPILADKYTGRRSMFFISLFLHIVFTIPLFWVTNDLVHMVLRFLQGLCFETNYLMPYIAFMEIIPPQCRDFAVMMSFIAWTFGMCFTALIAWLFPHWKQLLFISLLPSLLGFLYWRYFPNSPRWLLSKGKLQQCADILMKINDTNGTEKVSRRELKEQLAVVMARDPVNRRPLSGVLAYPRVALRVVALVIMSFLQFVVYSVAMLSMTVLSNSFLAHFVLSIFELPSNFIGWATIHYFGRRFMAFSTYLLLAGFCFAAYFCTTNEMLLLLMLGFVKLFSTCGLFVIFLMATEALPTPIRTSCTGFVVVSGMIGMLTGPHVLHSGLGEGGQYWILLAMSVASAVCMIPFPETLGLQLPQTFQEAETLGQDRSFRVWIHHWNFHKYMEKPSSQ